MSTLATAMSTARALLAFIGVMTVLGASWTVWERIAIAIGLVLVAALTTAADGHRLTLHRIPRPTRYSKAA